VDVDGAKAAGGAKGEIDSKMSESSSENSEES
jgi:hypothetical protein